MKPNATEEIELYRGGEIVSSITGAFGQSLKETRLTAMLGYLIASSPTTFLKAFRVSGKPLSVSLETQHDKGRSDILIETTRGDCVIEAKVGAEDPIFQSKKYPGRWRVLISQLYPPSSSNSRIRYVQWKDVGKILSGLTKSGNSVSRLISRDILSYLEEHKMVRRRSSVEVFAREINEEDTLQLYLRGRIYSCQYESGSSLPEALYFAPHFGKSISKAYPGVHVGISYIARIEQVEVVDTYADFLAVTRKIRGKSWCKRNASMIRLTRTSYKWSKIRRSFLYLGEPRLVFNPPVHKDYLQKGKGWLSKRYLTFDKLFTAWSAKNRPQ